MKLNMDHLVKVYTKHVERIMLITLALSVVLLTPLIYHKIKYGEFVSKDWSIVGGSVITISTNKTLSPDDVLRITGIDGDVKILRDRISGKLIGYEIYTSKKVSKDEIEPKIKSILPDARVSVVYQSPTLGKAFLKQATIIIIASIILMGLMVYYFFRNLASTLSIMFTTTMDLLLMLSFMDMVGLRLSVASLGALLMILGYSTDSDVLLSTYLVKRSGPLEERIKRAFMIELTMNAAALVAFSTMYVFSIVEMVKKIAEILLLGLVADVFTTWGFGSGLIIKLVMKK